MAFSFDSLPINTLVGADRATFDSVTRNSRIERRSKYLITKGCQRLLSPIFSHNQALFRSIDKPQIVSPIFILGHWRSGTTFLHNLLSRDNRFGYCTTYQTVFPHLMFAGSTLFKRLAKSCMPKSRPSDGAELNIDQPQEEEFAIANMTRAAYYHFWLFPQQMALFREKYLLFNSCTEQELTEFCNATIEVMQTALYCQGKSRFLSKNPPHTARVAILLQLFPDAKFIYIHRKAEDVISSTKRFFRQTIDAISLQSISTQQLDKEIVTTYNAVIDRYKNDRVLIPTDNLCEITFEQLTHQPESAVEHIYKKLEL